MINPQIDHQQIKQKKMAKKKQPSLGNVIRTVRTENSTNLSRITELEKDVKSLETSVLAIMEIIRRKGLMKEEKTKTQKITGIKSQSEKVNLTIEKDTAKDILLKIYTFMTNNSE